MIRLEDAVAKALAQSYEAPVTTSVTMFDDAKIERDTDYTVKGLFVRGTLIVVYGAPGSGKSFWVLDVVAHIAAGKRWRNQRVRGGLVAYVAAEAGASILRRAVAWRQKHLAKDRGSKALPLAFLTGSFDLTNAGSMDSLLASLRELEERVKTPLNTVVIDTASRAAPGADENGPEGMSAIVGAADRIRIETGAAVILVHHAGKDSSKGARGHSSLPAASDTITLIENRVAIVEKARDGTSGVRYPFALDVVDLGRDSDGDPITTCVVTQVDEATVAPKVREPTGSVQRLLLRSLRELVDAHGKPHPIGRAVEVEALLKVLIPKMTGKEPWRARQHLLQSIASLQANGYATVHADWIAPSQASANPHPTTGAGGRKYQ